MTLASIWNDMFHPQIITFDKRTLKADKVGEMTLMCTVPGYVWHWDAIFTMYLLIAPHLATNPATICNFLIKTIFDFGQEGTTFENFPPQAERLIHQFGCGEIRELRTLIDPLQISINLQCANLLSMYGDRPDFDEDKMSLDTIEAITKDYKENFSK